MIKIAVTGPESTGKSWLASKLADHFHTVFVPEYAREYLQHLDRTYQLDDLVQIARGQQAAHQQGVQKAHDLVFFDTDFLVLKIWCQHRFHEVPHIILNNLEKRDVDLYLLCNVDLPWEYDPQREHPHLRQFFFDWYRRELDSYGFPYLVISGQGDQRLQAAIDGVQQFIQQTNNDHV